LTSEVGCGAWASNVTRLFREHAIDDTLLPSLTAGDLGDFGIGIVGHRRKLMNAIAALNAETGAASAHTRVTFLTRTAPIRPNAVN
jgi:SAM domain (Sterile alpha motif)